MLDATYKYLWDGWNLVMEVDGEDMPIRSYAWGLDLSGSEQGAGGVGGLCFATEHATNVTYHASFDYNGNLTSLRNPVGGTGARYEYGPFGESLTARDALAGTNPFRFSTKYTDAETGLVYYGYRYYNASLGRWLSRDPIGEKGGVNLNAMLANSTPNSLDLLGLNNYERECLCEEGSSFAFPSLRDKAGWQVHLRRNARIAELSWNRLDTYGSRFVRSQLSKMYSKYADMYFYDNRRFLWAGGAASAKSRIINGVSALYWGDGVSGNDGVPGTQTFLSGPTRRAMIRIAQGIFDDIGWHHQAYIEGGLQELRSHVDNGELSADVFFGAWCELDDPNGNWIIATDYLVKYEQERIAQPHWDTVPSLGVTFVMSWFAGTDVPDSNPFYSYMLGYTASPDITNASHRLHWLFTDVMPAWYNLGSAARDHLVSQADLYR